jgi:hypothetical protein
VKTSHRTNQVYSDGAVRVIRLFDHGLTQHTAGSRPSGLLLSAHATGQGSRPTGPCNQRVRADLERRGVAWRASPQRRVVLAASSRPHHTDQNPMASRQAPKPQLSGAGLCRLVAEGWLRRARTRGWRQTQVTRPPRRAGVADCPGHAKPFSYDPINPGPPTDPRPSRDPPIDPWSSFQPGNFWRTPDTASRQRLSAAGAALERPRRLSTSNSPAAPPRRRRAWPWRQARGSRGPRHHRARHATDCPRLQDFPSLPTATIPPAVVHHRGVRFLVWYVPVGRGTCRANLTASRGCMALAWACAGTARRRGVRTASQNKINVILDFQNLSYKEYNFD